VLALVLTAGVGLAENKADKSRAATTPEEAVKFYRQAIKARDINGVAAQMAEPQRGYFKATLELQRLQRSLQKALDEEFGTDANAPDRADFQQYMKSVKDIRVVARKARSKERVDLTLWQTGTEDDKEWIDEFRVTAVKQGDAWKLNFPLRPARKAKTVTRKGPDGKEVEVFENVELRAPGPAEMKHTAKTMPAYKAAMEKVVKAIQDGKYKTRSEALKAIGAATLAFYQANPRPRQGS
jgi:hypothetical protein